MHNYTNLRKAMHANHPCGLIIAKVHVTFHFNLMDSFLEKVERMDGRTEILHRF